jgi:hypothetical protein
MNDLYDLNVLNYLNGLNGDRRFVPIVQTVLSRSSRNLRLYANG